MLKFVLMSALMCFYKSMTSAQLSLFSLTLLFGVLTLQGVTPSSNLGLTLNLDFTSYLLILLSMWIIALAVGAMKSSFDQTPLYNPFFLSVMLLLLLILILSFSCTDYILFYFFFESSLIPTLLLIMGWGFQPERISAGIYMLFYTLFGSLPLLLSLISISWETSTSVFNLSYFLIPSAGKTEFLLYFCTLFAFMVKLPVFLAHLWLPKAHGEAPVAGSMVLAGVLLKLGGYGVLRLSPLFIKTALTFNYMWISLSLVGGTLVSLFCLRQTDMKALIAYSSVAHMALVICGLMVFNWWGLSGAVSVMVGHGLCSSGLFAIANMVYQRLGTRSLFISKGLLSFMPSMGLWWFLLSVSNMAAPPTLSLLGEVSLIISITAWSFSSIIFIFLLSFFSASYTLYLYSATQHGKHFSTLAACCSGKVEEYLTLALHWIPLNMVILSNYIII